MALSAGTQDYVSACSYNLEYMENLNQHMLLSDWIILIIVALFNIRALSYRASFFPTLPPRGLLPLCNGVGGRLIHPTAIPRSVERTRD